jgi:hypothetical protein
LPYLYVVFLIKGTSDFGPPATPEQVDELIISLAMAAG